MAELSEFDAMRLAVKQEAKNSLEDAHTYLKDNYIVAKLTEFAEEAGIEDPATTKDPLIEQLIAKLTSGEDAETGDESEAEEESEAEDEEAVPDEKSVLSSGKGRAKGVSLPAKVASYPPDQLWPQISGWELDQGLDEDAQAAYSEDELREYLAYLWAEGRTGQDPARRLRIVDYKFKGINRPEAE
jgi:hypothetical protein